MPKQTLSEQVIEAYEVLKLKPLFGVFGCENEVCGLTALALYTKQLTREHLKVKGSSPVFRWASIQFGVDFTCGFLRGFDGKPREHDTLYKPTQSKKWVLPKRLKTTIDSARFFAGYDCGHKVREHLLQKGAA